VAKFVTLCILGNVYGWLNDNIFTQRQVNIPSLTDNSPVVASHGDGADSHIGHRRVWSRNTSWVVGSNCSGSGRVSRPG